MMENKFEILRMPPENTNSVLVSSGNRCVIFDAWGRADDWDALLQKRQLKLMAIYSTHGHADHISAAPELAKRHNIKWFLNRWDNNLILWGNQILDMFDLPHIADDYCAPTDLVAGEYIILDNINMIVYETPGHSAGGLSFLFPDYDILLTGDTLFRNGIGRYDLPGGNVDILMRSVKKIHDLNLSDETFVVHGHDLNSTIALLHKQNQYFNL